jgi:hypothetical protein
VEENWYERLFIIESDIVKDHRCASHNQTYTRSKMLSLSGTHTWYDKSLHYRLYNKFAAHTSFETLWYGRTGKIYHARFQSVRLLLWCSNTTKRWRFLPTTRAMTWKLDETLYCTKLNSIQNRLHSHRALLPFLVLHDLDVQINTNILHISLVRYRMGVSLFYSY